MQTAKRLYLYSVLAVSLVPLLWGLSELVRITISAIGDMAGIAGPIAGSGVARDELSWAIALVIVAGPIWLVHAALVRRMLQGSAAEVADERASASRATYFFLVLIVTGLVAATRLAEVSEQTLALIIADDRPWGRAAPAAGALVVGLAWLGHLWVRWGDLRLAPERTDGDWLTRAYLYGALWVSAIVGAFAAAGVLSTVARQLVDLAPLWSDSDWWREAIVGPLTYTLIGAAAWTLHWLLALRLTRAPDPMGAAHRTSRTRRGYFLAVALASATAVLALATMSLRQLFAGVIDVWQPADGSRLLEDIGGPLVMVVPFLAIGWWHLRRGTQEAGTFISAPSAVDFTRAGRLVLAFVGLSGLAVGLAWAVQVFLDSMAESGRAGLVSTTAMQESITGAFALALVGLLLWTPAWARSQRERARDVVAAATATSRRAYLLLVNGLAVLSIMGALAFLVYQATRVLLDASPIDDSSWALAILATAAVVLAYHLWCLRSDLSVDRASLPDAADGPVRVSETIEISAPSGADFRVLNAAIRTELPEGYELRVVN